MAEPAAIWSVQRIIFDDDVSLTQNVILSHGREALKAIVRGVVTLAEISATGPLVNSCSDPRLPSLISDVCYQAGLASTILFNTVRKGRQESSFAYRLRQERVEYVKTLCDDQNVEIRTLLNRDVRNALTHIDERLADILTEEENVGWFIDTAIDPGNKQIPPDGIEVKYCRCYDLRNHRILHLGHVLDLKVLYAECAAVLAVVFGVEANKA
jgi:hypothetical protein